MKHPNMHTSTAKRVITRGTPDMREPHGQSPFHMKQKQFGLYEHEAFTKGLSQETVMDKSSKQSTIFDNTQRRQDPDRIMDEFPNQPMVYQTPGSAYMNKVTKPRPVTRPGIPFEGKGKVVSEAYRGARMDIREGKGYSKASYRSLKEEGIALGPLRVKHPEYFDKAGNLKASVIKGIKTDKYTWLQSKLGKKPTKEQPTPSATSLTELAQREGTLPRDEKPEHLDTISELPESRVKLPEPGSKPQPPSKSYRYPYNKQVISDIEKQEAGKLKVKR